MANEEIRWDRLFHAYGLAADLPARLGALRGDDTDAASDAGVFLIQRLHGTGRLTPATAPAITAILPLLHDPALDGGVRDSLLFLLGEVARTAVGAPSPPPVDAAVLAWRDAYLADPARRAVHEWTDEDAPGRVLLAHAARECFDLLPTVFGAVWPVPAAWPAWTRALAASTLVPLVRHPDLADRCPEVVAHHRDAARTTTDRRECAAYVLGLGELGEAPREWLDDPRLAVRTCAALAPALADDPQAVDLLVRVAVAPRAFDHSFVEPFVPRSHRLTVPTRELPRRLLIRTVCERVADFGKLLSAAFAAAELHRTVEFGPYLRVAFPDGLPAVGEATGDQASFARVIADRDDLWDGSRPGAAAMFAAAGLPADRDRWREVRMNPERCYDVSTITVLGPGQAVRMRPSMYFGVGRTDPELPSRMLAEFADSGMSVQVQGPLRFTARGSGELRVNPNADGLDAAYSVAHCRVATSFAAGLSLWMTVHRWADGVAYRQQFVDGAAMGPAETVGPTDQADGVLFEFELDDDWLPPGARLPGA
ncbi:hypothetical protein [Catellatospora sichuanensis]|uniref:hypothetical protein n=1 Tax=Catellatospora sichuanensis TaxID=1969805 RepID=UPI001182028A|nr:hypothetical protein [Catellatospora sichuanensis]